MRKRVALMAILIGISGIVFGQELLNTDKYKDAELFVAKKDYDVQQRLEEIKSIVGKEVTVYHVSGKQNKIKLTYTGIAEMSSHPKFTDKAKASLIVVKVNENGRSSFYFPLTNDKRFRIYLTEKMK